MTPPLYQPIPLDYVPVSRIDGQSGFKPTKWKQPSGLKRATSASIFFGCAAALAVFYPVSAAAIFVMVISVLVGDRLAAKLNAFDDVLQKEKGRR